MKIKKFSELSEILIAQDYLIFTGNSFLWLLLPFVFIFSLLLTVFFNNTIWCRFLFWVRKYIWLKKLQLAFWFITVLKNVCYFWNTKQKTSIKRFSCVTFWGSKMICCSMKWNTKHCTKQTWTQNFLCQLYYTSEPGKAGENSDVKTETKPAEISLRSLPLFLNTFPGAAELVHCINVL